MSKELPSPEDWYNWRTNSVNDNFKENSGENDLFESQDLLNKMAIELVKAREDPSRQLSSEDIDNIVEESVDSCKVTDIDHTELERAKEYILELNNIYKPLQGLSRNKWDQLRHAGWLERVRSKSTSKGKKECLVEPLFSSRVYENVIIWLPQ